MTDTLTQHLRALEEDLLSPATRADSAAVARLLTDDFQEFGSSGRIFGKPAILEALARELPAARHLTEFVCEAITPDVALVTYRSHRQTQDGNIVSALRSSLWLRTAEGWRLHFHQGTTVPPDASTIDLCPS